MSKYIFGIPSAGAGPTEFQDWTAEIGDGIAFKKAPYQKSLSGPYVDDMAQAAEIVAETVLGEIEKGDDIYFFGHCMGASVAYEAANLFERKYSIYIKGLFISAFISPNRAIEDGIADWDDDAFIEEIHSHGTFPEEFFEKKSLTKLFLPRIRADYRLIENYSDKTGYKLSCPIVGFFGKDDESVKEEDIEGWKNYTTAHFEKNYFPGNHYFYYRNQREILDIIGNRIKQFEDK